MNSFKFSESNFYKFAYARLIYATISFINIIATIILTHPGF